jgi:uncharacterized membrane protein
VEPGASQTADLRNTGRGVQGCARRARRQSSGAAKARPNKVHAVGYAILRSIHLLAVVVWVGGMFFAHYCLRPAAAALEPPLRATLMRDALRRFLDIVFVAALLVLASGVWMIASTTRASTKAGLGFAMPIDWHVMVTLGVVMIAIYGYVRFAAFKALDRAVAAREWPVAAAALVRIRRLVLVNLVLAVVIIVVTRLGAIA